MVPAPRLLSFYQRRTDPSLLKDKCEKANLPPNSLRINELFALAQIECVTDQAAIQSAELLRLQAA
jgi:hypothetical protein